jgi:hypothetical protein
MTQWTPEHLNKLITADNSWRIKTNAEINDLINNQNIVNYVRSLRISYIGHL